MPDYEKLYIAGGWVTASGDGAIDVINPATEEVFGTIPQGGPKDVDSAVAAAARAFEPWSQTPIGDRVKYLTLLAEGLAARGDEMATTIASEVGSPLFFCQLAQVGLPQGVLASFPTVLDDAILEERIANSLVVKEPVGVVGCITPWNFPLHQIIAKIAPALAAGCTVVLKPSELAPMNAFILAELLDDIGLPPGVFNLVSGFGSDVGEAIAAHPLVDMVSFTGSTRTGTRISTLAAPTIKRVALELGGKSANLILDDADLEAAVKDGVGRAYINSGQACSALTRMLVPRARMAEAEDIARAEVETKWQLTEPFGSDGLVGPLVSAVQRDRVRQYIESGTAEGARLVVGGPDQPEAFERGYYVEPTVFTDVDSSMKIAREEIFGPVLSILAHDGDDDAVRIANDSPYGLAGAVSSSDPERALAVARRVRTGQMYVNGAPFNLLAPFGGYKLSGNGRELGLHGLDEFFEVKSIQLHPV